jgi:hypothetical protein
MSNRDCECGCGGTTKGGAFIPGHDAKRKSYLINAAKAGDADALAELDERNWMHFYDKSVARRDEPKVRKSRTREELGLPDDGLPKTAQRVNWTNWDEVQDGEIVDALTLREVVVERPLRNGKYGTFRESIEVLRVGIIHENGEIEIVENLTRGCRVIRAQDIVGIRSEPIKVRDIEKDLKAK